MLLNMRFMVSFSSAVFNNYRLATDAIAIRANLHQVGVIYLGSFWVFMARQHKVTRLVKQQPGSIA